ncbi:MFS transporter [Taibaiella soli]|uniref:MFS transporter n=1 Tax=Taibaiella soli TaxID=1649169 RepID=A0A2W2B3M0_9BACT|nr:MFS transporter [Taibaiella soli]PZF74608.1 MFS transporter [Taibaiella soli]
MSQALRLYRNAYSGLSPSTWLLSFVMLVNRCGTMVVPFMTLYLTESKHVSLGKAGLVMAIFGAGAVCGGFIGGRLTDKIGFYFIQLYALVGGGLMFILLGKIDSYPLICVTTFFLSVVNESFRPANATAIAHYSKEENRTRSYSLNRLAINLGWALGGTIGGFLASHNYHLLFWVDGISNITAAALLWLFLAPSKNTATVQKIVRHSETEVVRSAYKDRVYIIFILLTIIFAFCFFQLFSTVPLFYKEQLRLDESFIGIVMGINGVLIACFEMVTVYSLEGKRHNLYYIVYGVIMIALSYAVFNLLHNGYVVAVASVLLATVGEIFSMPFMNSFWTSRCVPENRGQYAGLYTVAWSIAQIAGMGAGPWLAQQFGFAVLWWCIAGLCLFAAVAFKWLSLNEDIF